MISNVMSDFFEGLRRWYLRRFFGIVPPPAQYRGHGTTWHQHTSDFFFCKCGWHHRFTKDDYLIRSQDHAEGCKGVTDLSTGNPVKDTTRLIDMGPCSCPVTDARYVKVCPTCKIGHWKQAS